LISCLLKFKSRIQFAVTWCARHSICAASSTTSIECFISCARIGKARRAEAAPCVPLSAVKSQ